MYVSSKISLKGIIGLLIQHPFQESRHDKHSMIKLLEYSET